MDFRKNTLSFRTLAENFHSYSSKVPTSPQPQSRQGQPASPQRQAWTLGTQRPRNAQKENDFQLSNRQHKFSRFSEYLKEEKNLKPEKRAKRHNEQKGRPLLSFKNSIEGRGRSGNSQYSQPKEGLVSFAQLTKNMRIVQSKLQEGGSDQLQIDNLSKQQTVKILQLQKQLDRLKKQKLKQYIQSQRSRTERPIQLVKQSFADQLDKLTLNSNNLHHGISFMDQNYFNEPLLPPSVPPLQEQRTERRESQTGQQRTERRESQTGQRRTERRESQTGQPKEEGVKSSGRYAQERLQTNNINQFEEMEIKDIRQYLRMSSEVNLQSSSIKVVDEQQPRVESEPFDLMKTSRDKTSTVQWQGFNLDQGALI